MQYEVPQVTDDLTTNWSMRYIYTPARDEEQEGFL